MAAIRVNFNKGVKMHIACATDTLRPAMQCISFKDGYAFASDGRILVKNKIEECSSISVEQIEMLNGKLLHKDSYKEILKYDSITISDDGIEAVKGDNKAFFYFADSSLKYPNAEEVIKSAYNKPNTSINEVGFSLNNINRILSALNESQQCKFRFKGDAVDLSVILENMNTDIASVGLLISLSLYQDN